MNGEETERLYKIIVDLGELGERQTISSLDRYYTPEELLGKKIVFSTNLKPRISLAKFPRACFWPLGKRRSLHQL